VKSPHLSHAEGTGLGLAIVKSLIDLHGGELIIKSKIDKGTSVTVILPFKSIASEILTNNKSDLPLSKFG
jgi:signal transduction histidine kinase